jgi:hypothetical protein
MVLPVPVWILVVDRIERDERARHDDVMYVVPGQEREKSQINTSPHVTTDQHHVTNTSPASPQEHASHGFTVSIYTSAHIILPYTYGT